MNACVIMPYGSTTASVVSSFKVECLSSTGHFLQNSPIINGSFVSSFKAECLSSTGRHRVIRCLILIGYFLQKSPIINGSFAKITYNSRHPMSLRHPLRELSFEFAQSASVFLRRAMSFEYAQRRESFLKEEGNSSKSSVFPRKAVSFEFAHRGV